MARGDEAEVDLLLRAAFGGPKEAEVVLRLRANGDMVAEQVKPWEDRIGAYAAVSRMAHPAGWYTLGPVAVWPEWQNGALWRGDPANPLRNSMRFGTRLVRDIAELFTTHYRLLPRNLVPGDPPTLVVLGKPTFYTRCGFSSERAARLTSPYSIAHTMIARAGNDIPEEALVYPPAFDGV
jgi:putative acetyltransferase